MGLLSNGPNAIAGCWNNLLFFMVVWMATITLFNNDGGRVQAQTSLSVVRIPTGSDAMAGQVAAELARIGLENRFDHLRTKREIEIVLDSVELQRLKNPISSPLHLDLLPDPSAWIVVRNLTNLEPGIPRSSERGDSGESSANRLNPTRHHNGYLPLVMRSYHDNSDTEHILRAFVRKYPDLATMQRVGGTSRGGIVWALILSTSSPSSSSSSTTRPGSGHSDKKGLPSKPAVLLMGSPHGNDMVGREMCLWTLQYLCQAYGRVSAIRRLLDRIDVHVIPVPNPGAAAIRSRYTPRGFDLDRGFHDRTAHRSNPSLPESEVELLMEWFRGHNFVSSMSFLGGGGGPAGGEMVVRYPWTSTATPSRHLSQRTPDDRAFRYLARIYAQQHPVMARDDPRGRTPDAGTVNGAEWYGRYGSLQDWAYDDMGVLHLDLVISPYLKPLPQHLGMYWNQNHQPILAVLRAVAERGVSGTVVDAETGYSILGAKVAIRDIMDHGHHLHVIPAVQEKGGFFARFLAPGRYALRAEAPGYHISPEHLIQLNDRQSAIVLSFTLDTHH